MVCTKCVRLLAIASLGLLSGASAQDGSPFQLYFTGGIADAGLLGGAAFTEDGDFWLIGFGGEQRIRHLELTGSSWSGTDSVVTTNLALFGKADDLRAGSRNLQWGGQTGTSPGALLLNPAPLTIDIPVNAGGTQTVVYPAGTLAFIADNVGNPSDPTGTVRHDVTKRLYRYDLRTTADPTTVEPDFPSNRGFPGGPVVGLTGWADWYDVFQHVVSEQDFRNQTGSTGSSTMGRQFAWSSDGQSIYAINSGAGQGGIYRIDPTRTANDPGGIELLFDNTNNPSGGFSVRSEPAIVPTSVYDFDPASPLEGDQLLVEGNAVTGNEGGINSFHVEGVTSVGDPTVVFTQNEFRQFADYYSETTTDGTSIRNRSPRYVSIANAPNGDLYVYEQQTDVMFRRDTQGRFVKVASEREHNLFQQEVRGSFGNDDMSNISIRTSTAPGFEVTELVFVDSSINAPIGILVYEPGDFDRDNDRDGDDFAAFAAALGTRNTAADDANVAFDLNGNEVASRDVDSLDQPYIRYTSNEGVVVDWKDVKILQQFAEFPNGDTNFDMTLDFVDLTTMSENYYTEGQTAATWVLGDFASEDPDYIFDAPDANLVNAIDLEVLADAWVNDLGLPAPSESELDASFDGQFLIDAIAAFAVDSGLVGDYDRDGDVDEGDYDTWVAALGEAGAGLGADGNGDGVVDGADYTVWRDALVIDPLAADFNADGVVDAADYTVWRDTLGNTGDDLAADANGDRVVDEDDYDRWVAAFGAAASPSGAVPEPGTLLLALVGGTLLASRRR